MIEMPCSRCVALKLRFLRAVAVTVFPALADHTRS